MDNDRVDNCLDVDFAAPGPAFKILKEKRRWLDLDLGLELGGTSL
jgi:hypothetical protein